MTPIDNSKPVVLVTGATGFVGSRLVEALVQRGQSVACLIRKSSNPQFLQTLPVRLIEGDLESPAAIHGALRGIETVYHVAGSIKAANRDSYFRVNQIGTRRLLEALAEGSPGLKRFIHVSSLAAAGPSPADRGLTEDVKPNPISWYGESKLESEREALRYAGTFRVTILRPSAVYGPRDRETLAIFRMVKGGCLLTPGRFTRRFSLIYVDDLITALMSAGEQDTPSGEVFFVSRPEMYTWEQVGAAIALALGRKCRRIAFPAQLALVAGAAGDLWARLSGRPATINSQKIKELLQPSWLCDSSKASRRLGFHPQIELETGIQRTARWYQEQGWL